MEDNNFTYKEIMTQFESWNKVYDDIVNKKVELDLNIFSSGYDEIIFFGCGSSYNLSQSASFFTKMRLNGISCIALPSSELLINTDTYIKEDRKYLIIGFSRSGETAESINILKKLKKIKNIISFIFTCKKGSTILNFSNNSFICRGAEEKSIVMTVSFSSMLFAYCLMLTKYLNKKDMLFEFRYLIDYISKNINKLFENINNYVNGNYFNNYFALGSGFNYGLAVEADLKMKEMTQIPSYSYYLHEFNHGPKSLLDKDCLCLILNSNRNLYKNAEIIDSISSLGSKVLIIGYRNIDHIENKSINYLLFNSDFKFNTIKSFINIPAFQILAYIKTIKENLNPDEPRHLDYTIVDMK